MNAKTTPPPPAVPDEQALADCARLHRMVDEVLWLLFAERRTEPLQ
jgi:hypothetical protein